MNDFVVPSESFAENPPQDKEEEKIAAILAHSKLLEKIESGRESLPEDDIIAEDGTVEVYTSPDAFEGVLKAFDDAGIAHESAEVTMIPNTYQDVPTDKIEKILNLIDLLDDLDDVQNVYSNLNIPADYQG